MPYRSRVKTLARSFFAQTLVAIAAGIAVAIAFGPKVAFLGIVAKAILVVIKTFATPLLFLAIVDSVLQAQFGGRGIVYMIGISAFNGLCAVAIALFISNTFHPGTYLKLDAANVAKNLAGKKTDWGEAVLSQLPDSLIGPFLNHNLPAVILLALFFGFAIRSLGREQTEVSPALFEKIKELISFGLKVHMKVLRWIVAVAPIAIFAAVAKSVSEKGLALLPGLGAYVLTCLVGMTIQVVVVYQTWIAVVGRRRLGQFWRESKEAILYSFGVNSSLATLPLSLSAMERLNVSPASARLSACVGTNLNNDGILLYEVAAALFLAQAYGVQLGLWDQLALAGVCVFATIGVAGVPDAGIIALALVLSTAGLPDEALPILLSVDWIVARCRSMVNVTSDLTVAIGIDALEGVHGYVQPLPVKPTANR